MHVRLSVSCAEMTAALGVDGAISRSALGATVNATFKSAEMYAVYAADESAAVNGWGWACAEKCDVLVIAVSITSMFRG